MINLTHIEHVLASITRMDITATTDSDDKTIGTLSAILVRPVLADYDSDLIDMGLKQILGDDFETEDMCDEDTLLITDIYASDLLTEDDMIDLYVDLVGSMYQIACQTFNMAGMEIHICGEAARKLKGVAIVIDYGTE